MIETIILLGLASHRLWVFWLTQAIFRPLREGLGKAHSLIQYLVNCPTCMSLWVAGGVGVMWYYGGVFQGLVWLLAISEVISMLESIMRYIDRVGMARLQSQVTPLTPQTTNGELTGNVLRRS
jgi:hypothetical protein